MLLTEDEVRSFEELNNQLSISEKNMKFASSNSNNTEALITRGLID